jgi:RNA polymerase sigma factor (sigma-70 family)
MHEAQLVEDSPGVRAALESLGGVSADGPHEQLRRQELARLVRVTLDYLPDRYGDALEWKYIQELSVREIAARLRIGPKAAESLLTRARQAFRDAFAALHAGAEAWER